MLQAPQPTFRNDLLQRAACFDFKVSRHRTFLCADVIKSRFNSAAQLSTATSLSV
jgi:hypothetical protein